MDNKTSILVSPDGSIRFVWDDRLAPLTTEGRAQISRASHVEPNIYGEWTVDLSPVGGPILAPFRLRGEALRAEIDWLERHLFGESEIA